MLGLEESYSQVKKCRHFIYCSGLHSNLVAKNLPELRPIPSPGRFSSTSQFGDGRMTANAKEVGSGEQGPGAHPLLPRPEPLSTDKTF